jgi:4-hydroxyacetophenone monooxygenase
VAELRVFQRSAPWLLPTPNYHADVPQGMQWLLAHVPFYARWFRFFHFWMASEGLLGAVRVDPEWRGSARSLSAANDLVRKLATGYIRAQVADRPELASAVVPDYPVGGKRMLRDNGVWLAALQRDNVRLVTDPIAEVTSDAIVTGDGERHPVDVIIYGTGFLASRFLYPMTIRGRGGVTLEDHWHGDARAYLGVSVPRFPNLFCLYGPNTNIVVNGSIIFFSECAMHYVLQCLGALAERAATGERAGAMECKTEVHDAFNAWVDAENARMAWGRGVRSWYVNEHGRVSQNWPSTLLEYWQRTRHLRSEDYTWLP